MWQILRRSLRCPVILEGEITTLIFRWLSVCSRIYACRWGRHHVRLLAQDRIDWAGKFRLDCVLCSLHMGNIVTTFSVVLDCRCWEKPPVIGRKRTLQKTRTKWRNDTGWLLFLSLSLSFALFFCTSNTVLTSSAVRPCLQRLPNLAWTGKCQLGIRKHWKVTGEIPKTWLNLFCRMRGYLTRFKQAARMVPPCARAFGRMFNVAVSLRWDFCLWHPLLHLLACSSRSLHCFGATHVFPTKKVLFISRVSEPTVRFQL